MTNHGKPNSPNSPKKMHNSNTIFIIGATIGLPQGNMEEFQVAADIMKEHYPGMRVIIPHDYVGFNDLIAQGTKDYYNCAIMAVLAPADRIVTIPGWEHEDVAKAQVEIAGLLGKEIENIVMYQKILNPNG